MKGWHDSKLVYRDTSEREKVIAIGVATGVSALLALMAFFAWWCGRRKRAAQNTLQLIDHITNVTPSEPPRTTPTSRSREKLPFPSEASFSSTLSPTTAPSPTMTRQQHVLTFPSSTSLSSQPLLPLSTSTVASPQSGAGHVQVTHLGNLRAMATTVPLSPPGSQLGDNMDDVPPPAYSPPSSVKYSTT